MDGGREGEGREKLIVLVELVINVDTRTEMLKEKNVQERRLSISSP